MSGIMDEIVDSTAASASLNDSGLLSRSKLTSPNLAGTSGKQSTSQILGGRVQDVKVDNWGNYCLQRLQVMYDRGDFCDLSLRFHSGEILKVHRVIVNVCTDYFANLEKLYGLADDGSLALPNDVPYAPVVTIVKFFYTGKLEVKGVQFNDVYKTVKMMNIAILTKLLEAHARNPPSSSKKEGISPNPIASFGLAGATAVGMTGSPTKTLTMAPGVKLPPGVKTKTILARVQPQTVRGSSPAAGSKSVVAKKLPIWKERKYLPGGTPDSERRPLPKEEAAKPTRFDWAEADDDMNAMSPMSAATSMMDMKPKPSTSTYRKAEEIFDAVKLQTQGVKRAVSSTSGTSGGSNSPQRKLLKLDISEDDTHVEIPIYQDDGVNLTEETVEEIVSTTECDEMSSSFLSNSTPTLSNSSPTKSSLKSKSGGSGTSGKVEKQVRFAREIEKENKTGIPTDEVTTQSEGDSYNSHSKIISEIIKKYPDLVKDNKNIKLRIVHKDMDANSAVNSKGKSKVSYIVLKSSSTDSGGTTVLKKPTPAQSKSFWQGDKTQEKPASGAENISGPWLCGPCGGGDTTPMDFPSYYLYRRHLVEVHGERIDARICEYCGQKASKRNLLLFHLYTKHGVPPPKNCNFPHCDRCDYVALSESLLTKHKQSHDANKEFACTVCNASFKSSDALQGHMAANLHRNKDTKVYECPYCRKPFVRNINLKGHIRSHHKDIARIEEMEDPRLPQDDSLSSRPVTIVHSQAKKRLFPSILGGHPRSTCGQNLLVPGDLPDQSQRMELMTPDGNTIEILQGVNPPIGVAILPSSEAEGLANVASSIACSLGLETQGHTGEFITGIDNDGQPAVYIMDAAQSGVEVDMSGMGVPPATMILEDSSSGQNQYIVQDLPNSQFRRFTGMESLGKQVIFFQISTDASGQLAMGPLDDGTIQVAEGAGIEGDQEDGSTHFDFVEEEGRTFGVQNDHMYLDPQKCSVFVPLTTTEDGVQQQVILSSDTPEGAEVIQMVTANSNGTESSSVDSTEVLLDEQQQLTFVTSTVEEVQDVVNEQLEQPVEELQLVLDEESMQMDKVDEILDPENLSEIPRMEGEVEDPSCFTDDGKIQTDDETMTGEQLPDDTVDEAVIDDPAIDDAVIDETVIHEAVIHEADTEQSISEDVNVVISGDPLPDGGLQQEEEQMDIVPDVDGTVESVSVDIDSVDKCVVLKNPELDGIVDATANDNSI